jgi:hypothetical protein
VVAVVAQNDPAVIPVECDTVLFVYVRLKHFGIPPSPNEMGLKAGMPRVAPELMYALGDRSCKRRRLRFNETLEVLGDY